jgi:hypothetical protein
MFKPSLSSISVLAIALATAGSAGAYTVHHATGATADDILDARAAFRVELGGGDTASGGSFGGLRREINWDGAPDAASDPAFMPPDQFRSRGALFTTNGSGVMMSAKQGNPTSTPILFGSQSALYPQIFEAFTAERAFSPIGSNRLDVTFVVPGTDTPALSRGLGVVFSDVDLAFTTAIEYFTLDGTSLGKFFVPASDGNQSFSFLGVAFEDAVVHRAEITLGTVALGSHGEPAGHDAVVTDDFIFGEPEAAAEGCQADATTLCLNQGRFELRVAFATSAGGPRSQGRAIRLGADSGAFWFFNANNLEMLVKVLDACALNDRFWFFSAAATNVELEVTVTDTLTDTTEVYTKAFGPPAPAITDTDAFATCQP